MSQELIQKNDLTPEKIEQINLRSLTIGDVLDKNYPEYGKVKVEIASRYHLLKPKDRFSLTVQASGFGYGTGTRGYSADEVIDLLGSERFQVFK